MRRGGSTAARAWGRRDRPGPADTGAVRDAVRELVETGRCDAWFAEVPDEVLVRLVAPLEMLTFQYYLDPPRDRHLVRAARVACDAMDQHLDACPADLAGAFRRLRAAITASSTPANLGLAAPGLEDGPARKEPA
jgi:hypothetical protein